ncbi:LOG family protein [Nostocoides sp. HKS02]|uniref:LOG family protein n=1 Tax=Nostocoides sp. HKS02 TaxID=1813880 RepID=UPI0012B44CA4|nr:Rossmann fold nucleotide-binding protein [Tetrasphaera sp. HKS02]QGN57806.1 Rossmann fold nucleotide-binding protein [Tetrasphaera sp. HKS02]
MEGARRSTPATPSPRPSHSTEIENLTDLDAALASGEPLTGLRLQDLDLTAYEAALLARTDVEGLVVLGGRLSPALDAHLRAHRALIFPTDPAAPVDPYRATLYSPQELYAGLADHGYEATPDYLAYQWMLDAAVHRDAFVTLLRAIHDDSITDALDEFTGGRPVVGVMGGHQLARGTSSYAAAARLGRALADAGLVVATGGGPGAMEAANLGAFVADLPALEAALERLAAVPSFQPSVGEWALLAFEVRREVVSGASSDQSRSLGIPTWFYGHEPPNVFCGGIGKYFSNAIREDGLLARSTAGLVVLEGAAGTVQEIFQAVTPLFYAAPGAELAPLVLVGQEYWTDTLPVWPAVRALGQERGLGTVLHLVDTIEEAAAILTDHRAGATRAPR